MYCVQDIRSDGIKPFLFAMGSDFRANNLVNLSDPKRVERVFADVFQDKSLMRQMWILDKRLLEDDVTDSLGEDFCFAVRSQEIFNLGGLLERAKLNDIPDFLATQFWGTGVSASVNSAQSRAEVDNSGPAVCNRLSSWFGLSADTDISSWRNYRQTVDPYEQLLKIPETYFHPVFEKP